MEGRNEMYCYLYEGGEMEYHVGTLVKYKGGRVKGMRIYHGMSFDEFLDRACEKLKINREGKKFYYIVKYNPNVLLDLEDDEDVEHLVLLNNEFACVYIVHSAREEGVQREIIDREDGKCCIGRDAVSSSASCEVLCNTKQPIGYASGCVEWEVKPLESQQNREGILGLGHAFKVFNAHTVYEVDLKEGSCTCKAWKMSGLPCEHACAVARMIRHEAYEYVEPCQKLSPHELINSGYNIPKRDIDHGVVRDVDEDCSYPSLEPPKVKRPLGKPQRNMEAKLRQKRPIHCSRCHGVGHNRATCTNP